MMFALYFGHCDDRNRVVYPLRNRYEVRLLSIILSNKQ